MPAPWPSSGFSPKASIATRQKSWRPAPERSAKCCCGLVRELRCRSWRTGPRRGRRPRSRRRSPAAPRPAAIRFSTVGLRESSHRAPGQRALAAPSSRRRPAKSSQRQRDPGEQDQQHGRRPGRPPPGWRGCRRGCGAPAPPAPPAAPRAPPIASVASSQRRSRERASRQPPATSSASRPPRE